MVVVACVVIQCNQPTFNMKVYVEGHSYTVENFESDSTQVINFIHKLPAKEAVERGIIEDSADLAPETLVTVNEGTTNEEVLSVLIDRMNHLQSKFPCRENAIVITKLEECLMWLNKRTADRKARNVEGKQLA